MWIRVNNVWDFVYKEGRMGVKWDDIWVMRRKRMMNNEVRGGSLIEE